MMVEVSQICDGCMFTGLLRNTPAQTHSREACQITEILEKQTTWKKP